MCSNITVTRRCVPLSRRTNIAGSNIIAHADVTTDIVASLGTQGDFQKDCIFNGWIGEI